MFRHIVLFAIRPEATPEQHAALLEGLHSLPGRIAEIRHFEVGVDADLAEGNADYAVVADFDDEAAYRAYAAHPAHVAVVTERVRPILASRTALQHHRTARGDD